MSDKEELRKSIDALERELSRRQSIFADEGDGSRLDAALEFGRQGVTFGAADEIEAGLKGGLAAVTTTGDVMERMEAARLASKEAMLENKLRRDSLRDKYPYTAGFSEMVGGGAIGFGTGASLMKNLTKLPAWMRPVTAGAIEGGLYGGLSADGGFQDRLEGAAGGTVLGAAATPVFEGVSVATLNALRPVARRVGEALAGTPRDRAKRVIKQALDADDITPDEALTLMREMSPNATLADLGDTLARQGRAASAEMGPAGSRTKRFLDERQREGQMNLRQKAREASASEGFDKGVAAIVNGAETKAAPIYREIESEVVDLSPALMDYLQRPAVMAARRRAKTMLQNEGFSGDMVGDVTDIRYLDAIKRALYDMEDSARGPHGRATNQSRVLANLRRGFVDEIDAQVPRYAEARNIFAGEAQIKDAADYGRTVFASNRVGTADAVADITKMSDGELQAARAGFLEWLSDELAKQSVNSNRLVNKFSDVPRFQEMTKALFPDQGEVNAFLREASAQAQFGRTRNLVAGGSPTARIQQDVSSLNPGLVGTLIDSTFTPGSMVANALSAIKGNTRLTPEVAEEMVDILFNPNIVPKDLKPNPIVSGFDFPKFNPGQRAGFAGGVVGSQIGNAKIDGQPAAPQVGNTVLDVLGLSPVTEGLLGNQ